MTGGWDPIMTPYIHPSKTPARLSATTMKQPKLSTYNGFVPAEAQMNLAAN
jgi:hypothetical protein